MEANRAGSIMVRVPRELADPLIAQGMAAESVNRRSTTWELLATFAGGAATTISLLQTPETLTYLARTCLTLARRPRASQATPPIMQQYLEAVGPKGQLRIPLPPDAELAQIERLLRRTIFAD